MNLYQADIPIMATVYIKASSLEEAQAKLRSIHMDALELVPDEHQEVPVCGLSFDNPDLPEVSLSPAMTIHITDKDVAGLNFTENLDPGVCTDE